ncbi:MAG: GDP-mannose 4,6-dehydratase [Candidatus Woesebacteria bacterium]|nr:GDP-mannose 4,6-dehydratase [Candidatus Woesebacteria bacterium]
MNIVITGGAGFIGSNLAAYYLRRRDSVIIFDNFSRNGSVKNLAWLKTLGGKLEIIKGAVTIEKDVARLMFPFKSADAIFHLAAQVAVTTSVENPRDDFMTNALGTLNILEAMRHAKSQAKFIYSSTNKVYGNMEHVKIVQEKNRYAYKNLPYGVSESVLLDFHSPYGCSKGAADQYVRDYSRIYGLDTVVFRQSCIYGPRQFGVEDQGWIAWFMIATVLGKKLTIYGDGKQVRDILYVDDLVLAYDMALKYKEETRGKIYNIGGGRAFSMSIWGEFRPILEKLFGHTLDVEFSDWRPGDQFIYISDIRKAQNDFGWEPRISVVDGIDRLYRWVSKNKLLFL